MLSQHVTFNSRILSVALCALIFGCLAQAQEGSAGQPPATDEAIIKQADEDLRRWESRRDLEVALRVDRRLKDLLSRHPDTPLREQVEERLAAVLEGLGEHNLAVALHYLRRFEEGKASHAKGAESRLRHILCEYPKFSRMGEVLGQLLRVYNLTGETEAAERVQRLINEPPAERNYKEACESIKRSR